MRIFVLYEDKVIAQSSLSQENKFVQQEEKLQEILNKRVYIPLQLRKKQKSVYTPPANHPWKKAVAKGFQMKQIKLSRAEIRAQKKIENLFGGLIKFVH